MLEHVKKRVQELESKVAYVEVRTDEFSCLLDTLLKSVALLHRASYEMRAGREQQEIEEFIRAFEHTSIDVKPVGSEDSSLSP